MKSLIEEFGGDGSLGLLPAVGGAVGGKPSGVYWVAASAVCGLLTGVRAENLGDRFEAAGRGFTAGELKANSLGDFVGLCDAV